MTPADYRKALTQRIIEQLEAGTAPWVKPWDEKLPLLGSPFNAITGRPYHGGNRLWLQCHSFGDPRWCTYRQAHEQGWQVRKGEKAAAVEYWQWDKQEKDDYGKVVHKKLDHPRVYYAHVFNAGQMEQVPPFVAQEGHKWQPEESAEKILHNAKPQLFHDQQSKAFYAPVKDEIHVPPKGQFPSGIQYYATVLHELGHWSGHASRLNRVLSSEFGSQDYAKEELKAELASFFLSSELGIPHDPGQHAAYIGSWVQALRKDHNEIFRAARDAELITDYVLQFQKERMAEKDAEAEDELEC